MIRKGIQPFITMEGSKMMMYMGHPTLNPTKIDVTMAFKIGLAIGSKQYEDIEHDQIKL
jgi:hypothetical protein